MIVHIPDPEQEMADRFYAKHGPCCAGCDWWHRINTLVGECHKSAPVGGIERSSMLEIHVTSLPLEAGHVMTRREHHCGDFKDEFDWNSLPAAYLRKIGYNKVNP
jgi:hypothetical protein